MVNIYTSINSINYRDKMYKEPINGIYLELLLAAFIYMSHLERLMYCEGVGEG